MQLVPEDLHYEVKHTGGAALLKSPTLKMPKLHINSVFNS